MKKLLIILILLLCSCRVIIAQERGDMMLLVSQEQYNNEQPSIYDLDYQAILDYATSNGITHPSFDVKGAQNAFLIALKTAGVWDKLDVLHIAVNDIGKDFAYINWINPGNYYIVPTDDAVVLFESGEGISQVGTTTLNTGYNPSLNGVNYTLNSASFGYRINDLGESLGTDDAIMRAGIDGTTQTGGGLLLYDSSFGCKVYLNNESNERFGNVYRYITNNADNFLVVNRDSSTNIQLYQNGSFLTNTETTAPTTGLPNYELQYFVNSFENTQVGVWFVGGSMTAQEISDFNSAIDNYYSTYVNELFTTSAAAIGALESNDTAGWSTAGQINITSESSPDTPQDGSYYIAVEGTDSGGTGDRAQFNVTIENGETYEIKIKAREAVGSDGRIQLFAGVSGWSTVQLTSTWTEYVQTVTATSTTMTMRFYPNNGSGSIGDTIHIDSISVIKQ